MKWMKWLEIIKLQASFDEARALEPELGELLARLRKAPGLDAMGVFQQASLSGDVCVLLLWNVSYPERWGSAVGLRLANFLKEFGLVDHSVWIGSGEARLDQAASAVGSE